jgi:hypothetical protein
MGSRNGRPASRVKTYNPLVIVNPDSGRWPKWQDYQWAQKSSLNKQAALLNREAHFSLGYDIPEAPG